MVSLIDNEATATDQIQEPVLGPGKPLFSFGIIADIQYADIDNKRNFEKTTWRYYRDALEKLDDAIEEWNNDEHPTSFILQLGDIIDGLNTVVNNSQKALDDCLNAFSKFKGQLGVHHTWGNHEYYNFSREFLLKSQLNSCPIKTKAYYDFSPFPGTRFIVLDTYEFSMLGHPEDSIVYKEAEELLRQVKSDREDLNSPDGISGSDVRFVKFNGGVSRDQLSWLEEVLVKAQDVGEWVILIGHQPIYEPSSLPLGLMWNFPDVLAVINRYSCVVAYISGHDHDGGYAIDDHGIHHITMKAIVETPSGSRSHATAYVYEDRIEVNNIGTRVKALDTLVMKLPGLAPSD